MKLTGVLLSNVSELIVLLDWFRKPLKTRTNCYLNIDAIRRFCHTKDRVAFVAEVLGYGDTSAILEAKDTTINKHDWQMDTLTHGRHTIPSECGLAALTAAHNEYCPRLI